MVTPEFTLLRIYWHTTGDLLVFCKYRCASSNNLNPSYYEKLDLTSSTLGHFAQPELLLVVVEATFATCYVSILLGWDECFE